MSLRQVLHALEERSGLRARHDPEPVIGGSTGGTFRLACTARAVLLKTCDAGRAWALEAEAAGLRELAATDTLRVPVVLGSGQAGSVAYLALEWIDFVAPTEHVFARLGRSLAQLHRHSADAFGWDRDSSLGATRQPNPQCSQWLTFLREQRLGLQLALARDKGLPTTCTARGADLLERLDGYFIGYRPRPSLLHGDLWAGNWGAASSGEPCVFDPALYYGDREADLAMARLFGGFPPEFYSAYDAEWPLVAGWERRAHLYELYHLLNHFNLFGRAYLPAVAAALGRL
jgi:protein-ribulosamine 3-kinase